MVLENATWHAIPIARIALSAMAIQNATAALLMHYSRVMPGYEDRRFFTSTAVLMSEVFKLLLCVCIARYNYNQRNSSNDSPSWSRTIRDAYSPYAWKMAIPAVLYTVQNHLQYIAISNLDAATFQVTYQLKIITTAVSSMVILQRQLNWTHWGALLLLTTGVAMVSIGSISTRAADNNYQAMNPFLGLLAIIVACSLSGLAGVYFEKVMKSAKDNLWNLNIQLSSFSLFPALFLGVIMKDGTQVLQHGFFFGYNWVVWTSIIIQAVGGLIVAICVLHADNIQKNFATSIAVLLSTFVSIFTFDFVITKEFCIGSVGVIYATFLYSKADQEISNYSRAELQKLDLEKHATLSD